MLVKLGDVWVDPARVALIRKIKSCAAPPMTEEAEIHVVEILLHEGHVYPVAITGDNPQNSFAEAVNESLAPKQSWSGDASEDAEIIPRPDIAPGAFEYKLKDSINETS